MNLRPADLGDKHMVFQWRNRTDIIEGSTLNRSVPWEEHFTWFDQTLEASSQAMYIIEAPRPVGQIRFDQLEGHVCQVGIYLLPEHQGRGLGVEALKQGCATIASTWAMPILAFIRYGNTISEKAFQKAGFVFSDLEPVEGHTTWEYAP